MHPALTSSQHWLLCSLAVLQPQCSRLLQLLLLLLLLLS
jgi:hypothetical protein